MASDRPQPDRPPTLASLEMAGMSITLLKADDENIEVLGRTGQDAGSALGCLEDVGSRQYPVKQLLTHWPTEKGPA